MNKKQTKKDIFKSKTVYAKDIRIELNSRWQNTKIIVDDRIIPFQELEIKQGQSTEGMLKCKLTLLPNKIIWIEK